MSANEEKSIQERYVPQNQCFGCGPANPKGLRIRSFPTGENGMLVCEWQPQDYHQAFGGVLNGGIIGALLDCHSNWTAAYHLMQRDHLDEPPPTVTAKFEVVLIRPTPLDQPVRLEAWPVSDDGPKVLTDASLIVGNKVTATCTGTFVAVGPGHPAYHSR